MKEGVVMADFPFDFTDVAEINHISGVTRGKIVNIDCPFCKNGGHKKLNINNQAGKQVARCNKCGWAGGLLQFHADLNGMSSRKDAKNDIEQKLSLDALSLEYKARAAAVRKAAKEVTLDEVELDLEERNKRYQLMKRFLKLDGDHVVNLEKRGLNPEFIAARGYKTLPVQTSERYTLARQIQSEGLSVQYLPGFYMDQNGDFLLRKLTRGIMIPIMSLNGRICGYQIRKDNDRLKYKTHRDKAGKIICGKDGKPVMFPENKFYTLSSSGMEGGGIMHSVCHYAGSYIWDEGKNDLVPVIRKPSIKITEGPLKADIYYQLTGEPMLAILGVNNVKQLQKALKELLSYYPAIDTVEDCLDMDYLDNPNVEKAVNEARNMIEAMGLNYVRRTWNPEYKGVDDFALAVKSGIYHK